MPTEEHAVGLEDVRTVASAGPRVLVVDDDVTARMLAGQSLAPKGFEVIEAVDGIEALAAFQEHQPNIVLMDVDMPQMDGFEATRQIRCLPNGRTVPVLMVTGRGDIASIEKAYEAGATDFVSKPLNWLILAQRFRYMLRAGDVLMSLQRSEQRLADSQRIAKLGHWEWVRATGKLIWSDQMFRLLGLRPGICEPTLRMILEQIPEQERLDVRKWFLGLVRNHEGGTYSHQLQTAEGRETVVQQQVEIDEDDAGRISRIYGATQDVTQLRRAEEKIQHLAYFDSLTGLPNRRWFRERVKRALAIGNRYKRLTGLLFIDLDDFKRINDTLGHTTGDLLLKQVAERIVASVRASDFVITPDMPDIMDRSEDVARLGGDEFTVLLTDLNQVADAAVITERIIEGLRQPLRVGGHEVVVTPSIGIAVSPYDGNDADTLLKNADTAMYHAKGAGRNGYQYFVESMNAAASRRLTLESQLRKALERGEMYLHFQPQADLTHGPIVGVEALLRWNNKELGSVTPTEFIPVAESTGLILPIGEWVLRQACIQARSWQDEGFPKMRMAVNLSARQLIQPGFPDLVRTVLEETNLEANCLELEVTESFLMDDVEGSISSLNSLKEIGVHLAIDDFGTGYSSLTHLKRFPIDRVKIDRSFVSNITSDPRDAALAMAVVAMAHSLKLRVTAEGVESAEQEEFLRDRRCHEAQGFHISRPLDPDKIGDLMRAAEASRALDASLADQTRVLLIVADSEELTESVRSAVENLSYEVVAATSTDEAGEIVSERTVDVVVVDQYVDDDMGLEFLQRTRTERPTSIRIVVSEKGSIGPLLKAINEGVIFTHVPRSELDLMLRTTLIEALLLSDVAAA